MRELCKSHNLALAPDGKCILCRRPALPRFTVRQETEDLLSRIVTGVLGACLLAAFSGLVYAWRLDPGLTGGSGADGTTRWTELPVAQASDRPVRATSAAKPSSAPDAGNAPRATSSGPLPLLEHAQTGQGKVKIVMYAAPWCYVCDRARDFLGADVVELVELDVESDPAVARAFAIKNPMQTLPTFVVRGETLVGFSPYDLEQAVRAALAPAPPAPGMLAARPVPAGEIR